MKRKEPRPRGETLVRVITGVLFAAFLLYGGMNLMRSLDNPFRTTIAVTVATSKTSVVRGYLARNETVIPGSGFIVPEVENGVKTAKNSVVAMSYGSYSDSGTVSQMRELKTRIEKLTAVSKVTAEERNTRSVAAVSDLALSLSERDLKAAEEIVIEAETLIMGAKSAENAQAEIEALERELAKLMAGVPQSTEITAPEAGVFVSSIDGYENISPEDIMNLTAGTLDSLFVPVGNTAGAGRIITGSRWYLALIVDERDGSGLIDARTVSVTITQPVQATFMMEVEEVGRSDGTSRVVVLSSAGGLTHVLDARSVTAEIVFNEVTGIRVPKAAIRLEQISAENTEMAPFVYLAEGVQATRVRVYIIDEFGDSYIVKGEVQGDEKQGAMSILRDGSEIIVKANDLYDGKIVR